MVELGRIERAIARRNKVEASIKALQETREQNRRRLDEIMKSLDPEVPLEVPYAKREIIEEIMRLRQALVRPASLEADFEACEQMNLLGANQNLDANIALGWQVPGVLKQVKILDGKIGEVQGQLARSFDARNQAEVDQMLKLRNEERALIILRWELVQRASEMLGVEAQELNAELAEKGVDAVRLELVEKLKPYGQKPRTKEESGGISFGAVKLE